MLVTSLNGNHYKTDTTLKWTPRVSCCLSLLLLVDPLYKMDARMELVSKVSILEGVDCTLTCEDLRVMVYISFA